jgi:uncharacterized protein YggE
MSEILETTGQPLKPVRGQPGRRLSYVLGACLVASLLVIAVLATKLMAGGDSSGRTVSVTGEATLKAEPDEYVFSPSYNFSDTNKEVALAALSKKSEEVVAGLKKLGVNDVDIKSNSNGYDSPASPQPVMAPEQDGSGSSTYMLQLSVTISSKDKVQKVQDYLVSTTPSGSVSPQASFSSAKRKELENTARNAATKDARSKADQSASNLGFKVGKVKTVEDGAGFGGVMPYAASSTAMMVEDTASSRLGVQAGQNELNYSVSVVYEIR